MSAALGFGDARAGARPPRRRDGRSGWLIALDWASLALAGALAVLALARVRAWPPLAWAPLLAIAALGGWAFADFGSGLVHFLCDRFGSERTPLLGRAVIRPFREHHAQPRAIASHGFAELAGNNALALTPLLAVCGELAVGFGDTLAHSAAYSGGMAASVGLFATNQIHRWAHLSRAPRFARALQRLGLAITPEAHAMHHRGAHDVAFCITTGWCNAILDRAQVWARAERALRRFGGSAHCTDGTHARTGTEEAS